MVSIQAAIKTKLLERQNNLKLQLREKTEILRKETVRRENIGVELCNIIIHLYIIIK